jgi:hypothetical protein
MSKASPAGDPYDSAADPTPVISGPLVIPPGGIVTITVDYLLDGNEPLLIAVEFSDAAESGILYREVVPQVAVAYYKARPTLQPTERPEAQKTDRSDYERLPADAMKGSLYLIEQIEFAK